MKKLTLIILALALSFTLFACNNTPPEIPPVDPPGTQPENPPENPPEVTDDEFHDKELPRDEFN